MKLYSKWGAILNREKPLQEYPRMQLVRDSYTNLNGVWDYQIVSKNEGLKNAWQEIVVPFGVGSLLSGVDRILKPDEDLWYKKNFTYDKKNKKTILHFEAVDQVCWVYLNGVLLGEHEGGYNPFSFDVSDIISVNNEILVKVNDYSETGIYAYGKQRLNPKSIWYTPVAGIWQTVWLEDVSDDYIEDIFYLTDFDNKKVTISLVGNFNQAVIVVSEKGKIVKRDIISNKTIDLYFDEIHPWSVDDPFLYDVYVETEKDVIKSYFGMRKISKDVDSKGKVRFFLNNKPLYLNGILDQGYISDGLYTFPSDEAMLFDITMAKQMGFNMLRKHVKQENRRFYYLCDKSGMLVFQDMINGGGAVDLISFNQIMGMFNGKRNDKNHKAFKRDNIDGQKMYYKELNDMILTLYNNPSVVCWVLFNEGWGQFDSKEVYNFVRKIDSIRLIDHASGWFDQGIGDFYSRHIYFRKIRHKNDKYNRINAISEFGGFSYQVIDNSISKKSFGYKYLKSKKDLEEKLFNLIKNEIYPCIKEGLSVSVLTQLSDVESECNGLLTFDRRVLKVNARKLELINKKLLRELNNE